VSRDYEIAPLEDEVSLEIVRVVHAARDIREIF